MVQTYPVVSGIQLLTAVVAVALVVTALRRGANQKSLAFGVVGFGAGGWALLAGLSTAVADPQLTYVLGFGIYPFSLAAAIGWLFLAGAYTGKDWVSNRRLVASLALLPVLTAAALASNPVHHLFLRAATTIPESGIVEPVPGPLYWGHVLLTTAIFVTGLGLLVQESLNSRGIYREQTRAVIGGGLFPLGFSLAEVLNIVPASSLDFGVLGLTVGAGVLFYALFYADFLKVVPIQRETLMENMEAPIVAFDNSGRVVDLNPRTTEYFGVSQDAIGSLMADAFADTPQLVRALEEDEHDDEISVPLDGETHHFMLNVSRVEQTGASRFGSSDGHIGRLVTIRDVTERRERERRLQQYQTVVETAGDPIFVLDDNGNIELLNDAMVDFLGHPREELVGTHIGNFLDAESLSKIMETITHMAVTGKSVGEYEMERTEPDGSIRNYEVNTRLIEDDEAAGDGIVGTVGVIRDVTVHEERKQELDLLGQILTRVLRHNIRNELTVVKGRAELLRDQLDGQGEDNAEKILSKSDNLITMADNARDAKQILNQTEQREPVDLQTVVESAIEQVRKTFPEMHVETSLAECWVSADPNLGLAVGQLVENAVEHNDSNQPVVEVGLSVGEETAELTVSDNGTGISDDELEVFEQGRETDLKHGSGLGLWIVTWIVERSEADISFESSDAGTDVHVTFQRAQTPSSVETEDGVESPAND